ncbi:L-fucose mutarotase [Paenibacillus dokdonensis]|uniref:L-fucose mutarotase n=1 Tax=Paenibacillus dokdonensis TaxID=2567944 RepID=A0ABU6GTP3_9BACL|nr:L-fucose mutarotase [Paenibacillus dokdonensis]MEC0241646.1 L-fucose mutarotase [Paenibacillus dokdonensis]
MLKGISPLLSPELLKILCEMGHGDEIVFADANFPAVSMAQRLVRADGHGIPELLEATLELFPLNSYVTHPVMLMQVMPGDPVETPVWDVYRGLVDKAEEGIEFAEIERFEFYERAQKAYAVVATGEKALYGNLILSKGVIA